MEKRQRRFARHGILMLKKIFNGGQWTWCLDYMWGREWGDITFTQERLPVRLCCPTETEHNTLPSALSSVQYSVHTRLLYTHCTVKGRKHADKNVVIKDEKKDGVHLISRSITKTFISKNYVKTKTSKIFVCHRPRDWMFILIF